MESLNPHNVRRYRRRARLGLALAGVAIPTTILGLVHPAAVEHSAIGIALSGPLDTLWLIGYLLGAVLITLGILWHPVPRPELEVLGLWLFMGSTVTNALAIIAVRGPIGGLLTGLSLFGLVWVLY